MKSVEFNDFKLVLYPSNIKEHKGLDINNYKSFSWNVEIYLKSDQYDLRIGEKEYTIYSSSKEEAQLHFNSLFERTSFVDAKIQDGVFLGIYNTFHDKYIRSDNFLIKFSLDRLNFAEFIDLNLWVPEALVPLASFKLGDNFQVILEKQRPLSEKDFIYDFTDTSKVLLEGKLCLSGSKVSENDIDIQPTGQEFYRGVECHFKYIYPHFKGLTKLVDTPDVNLVYTEFFGENSSLLLNVSPQSNSSPLPSEIHPNNIQSIDSAKLISSLIIFLFVLLLMMIVFKRYKLRN